MPHLLDSCYAKIQRAEENINNLNLEISTFLGREPKPYHIVRQFQNDGLQYAFIAKGSPVVPVRIAVLAGEIFHHLRSSLDHLLCALVLKNSKIVSSSHQFPICTTAVGFDKACQNGSIKGITASAKNIISSVQPYKTPDPEDTILQVVRHFNNLDKHRLPPITCTAAKLGDAIELGNPNAPRTNTAIVGLGDPSPRKITEEGVVVFTIDLGAPSPQFEAKAEVAFDVAFEKCGRVKLAPVIQTLRGIWEGTANTINLFKNEF